MGDGGGRMGIDAGEGLHQLAPWLAQVVTYKWLARHYALPANHAKRCGFLWMTGWEGQLGMRTPAPNTPPRPAWRLNSDALPGH